MQQHRTYALATMAFLGLVTANVERRQTTSEDDWYSRFPSCPGVMNVVGSSTACCVGGSLSIADVNLSSCPGWPICTGPVTVSSSSTPEDPPLTCATVIDANDPSYSSLLAAATSSIEASGTNAATTINPTGPAATPGESVSGGSSASATASSSTSRASSASSAASSAATSAASAADISVPVASSMLAWILAAVAAIL